MIINGKKAASLDPDDMLSNHPYSRSISDPELIIDDLLGPGVTIIGSRTPVERFILQEQMASSIVKGEDFLGILETVKSDVLYVVHGAADLMAMRARQGDTPGISIREGWPRLSQGGVKELDKVIAFQGMPGVIFLGDFDRIRSSPKIWLQKLNEVKLEQNQTPGPLDIQDLRRHVAEDDIRRLRDFAAKNRLSIVLGHGLSTNGVLYEMAGLGHRDNEIHIWKVREGHELEVLLGSPYVRAMTWDLNLDYDNRSYSLRDEVKKQLKLARAEASAPLALTERDRRIIDAMWDKEPMKLCDIEKASNLPHSTVIQRVKALQRNEKGEWIFKMPMDYYVVNQLNKRCWIQ